MRLMRCFVPSPLAAAAALALPAGPSAHIARVLRLRVGAALTLFDGHGGEFEAEILAIERAGVRVRVGTHHAIERESPLAVTLWQCVARAERMDWIVRKATELGIAAIVPVMSERCVVRLDEAGARRRQLHWREVAVSACEQCGRNRIPQLHPALEFKHACAAAARITPAPGARVLLAPAGSQALSSAAQALCAAGGTPPVSLLIGPEGGLSLDEIALAQQQGFSACRLGPRVLRTETAALAALATLQALLGDFSACEAATN
jgi:16S rRNA (uracil1498-N3)-methyltransferase